MVPVTFKLDGGNKITIFLSTNAHFAVLPLKSNPNQCRLIDGLHNNGGWTIDEKYDAVVERLMKYVVGK